MLESVFAQKLKSYNPWRYSKLQIIFSKIKVTNWVCKLAYPFQKKKFLKIEHFQICQFLKRRYFHKSDLISTLL